MRVAVNAGGVDDARFASLDCAERWIWQKLGRACRDRRSAWRTPVLATVGEDGAPRARILVLRAVDGAGRLLTLHSDARSGKMAELSASPFVALTFYDSKDQLQLRATGAATVLRAGPAVDSAWARVPDAARRNYRTLESPGSPMADAALSMDADGRRNFALIHIEVRRLEFLWLGADRHRRGAFHWTDDGCQRSWLVP